MLKREEDPDPVETTPDAYGRMALAASLMFAGAPISVTRLIVFDPAHLGDYAALAYRFTYVYSLIFMPLTAKQYGSVDGFLDRSIARCQEIVAQAEHIYLIGYSANDDIIRDILKPVRSNQTRLHVVGRSSAKAIQQSVLNWCPNLVEGFALGDGFEAFVEQYDQRSP